MIATAQINPPTAATKQSFAYLWFTQNIKATALECLVLPRCMDLDGSPFTMSYKQLEGILNRSERVVTDYRHRLVASSFLQREGRELWRLNETAQEEFTGFVDAAVAGYDGVLPGLGDEPVLITRGQGAGPSMGLYGTTPEDCKRFAGLTEAELAAAARIESPLQMMLFLASVPLPTLSAHELLSFLARHFQNGEASAEEFELVLMTGLRASGLHRAMVAVRKQGLVRMRYRRGRVFMTLTPLGAATYSNYAARP